MKRPQRMSWLVFGVFLLGCETVVQGGTNRYVSLTGNSVLFYTNWADAATNIQYAVDLDGRRRIDRLNGRVDMGAYEFIHKISLVSGH